MTETKIFYAARIPREEFDKIDDFKPEEYVSEDKNKIVSIARKCKGTRFKTFVSESDALNYVKYDDFDPNLLDFSSLSLNDDDSGSSNSPKSGRTSPSKSMSTTSSSSVGSTSSSSTETATTLPTEVPLPFPTIPIPKLSAFRRIIESDKTDAIAELIFENPRYLINYANDIPTILMISARYNAVHIAVRAGAGNALEYLLKTIDSIEFMTLTYPGAGPDELQEKRERLLDLYLNTPDKIANNSPLHYACINGHANCVKILLDYVPKCDIEYRNKAGQTAKEVIKEGDNHDKIVKLFDDCVYVAVVRSKDDLEYQVPLPCVGKKNLDTSFDPNHYRVSALAGPMSPQCARTLYRSISSPKHCTPEQREIRLRDPIRGLEKLFSKLTFDLDVEFQQY